jgi:hypothetical protein
MSIARRHRGLQAARAQGDLSENADYDAARNRQAQIEARITEIEHIKDIAVVVEEGKQGKKISLGNLVTYKEKDGRVDRQDRRHRRSRSLCHALSARQNESPPLASRFLAKSPATRSPSKAMSPTRLRSKKSKSRSNDHS